MPLLIFYNEIFMKKANNISKDKTEKKNYHANFCISGKKRLLNIKHFLNTRLNLSMFLFCFLL